VVLVVALLVGIVSPAEAATEAKGSEAKAIKKAFLKGREVDATVGKILVSTVDPGFASVSYSVTIDDGTSSRRAPKSYPSPTPELFKKAKGSKWKPASKAPKPVKKDLKVKDPKSSIQVSGEHTATLTRPASCGNDGAPTIYDPGSDTLLSVQFHGGYYKGPGMYPALGVGSVAGIYGNSGQTLLFETGQANDAFASSGVIYIDRDRWGIIDAYMSRTPPDEGTTPNSVLVSGSWDCR
jgi:hypothetical protein